MLSLIVSSISSSLVKSEFSISTILSIIESILVNNSPNILSNIATSCFSNLSSKLRCCHQSSSSSFSSSSSSSLPSSSAALEPFPPVFSCPTAAASPLEVAAAGVSAAADLTADAVCADCGSSNTLRISISYIIK